MNKVRIGVVSFEHMHAFSYTSALKKLSNVELIGIYDDNEYRGAEMAAQFDTKYFNLSDDLLDQDLDGVIICSNNRDHIVFAQKAIDKNIPFIVEKPLSNSITNGEKILNMTKENQAIGMMAFPMRFNPSIVEAKKIIDEGKIGEILAITGINHGKIPSGWFLDSELSGGGAIIDHTVHIADLIRWFTGKEFSTVFAEGGSLIHNQGIDDTGIILGTLDNGCCVSIDCSWGHHENYPIWPQVDMEFVGTLGSLSVKAFGLTTTQINKKLNINETVVWSEDGDFLMIQAFVDFCQGFKHSSVPTIKDGYKALKVAMSAYDSIELKSISKL